MSSLNLSPNPAVMVVQAGVFLTSILVVKKLFLDPYLRVRVKRDAMTTGSKAHADELLEKNGQLSSQITSRVSAAHGATREMRADVIKTASDSKQNIVAGAETEAKSAIDSVRSQIAQDIKVAKDQLPKIVQEVSESVYREVLS